MKQVIFPPCQKHQLFQTVCLLLWSSGHVAYLLTHRCIMCNFFHRSVPVCVFGSPWRQIHEGKQEVQTIYTDYFLFRDAVGLLNLTAAEDGPIAFYICLISSSVGVLLLLLLFTPSEAESALFHDPLCQNQSSVLQRLREL